MPRAPPHRLEGAPPAGKTLVVLVLLLLIRLLNLHSWRHVPVRPDLWVDRLHGAAACSTLPGCLLAKAHGVAQRKAQPQPRTTPPAGNRTRALGNPPRRALLTPVRQTLWVPAVLVNLRTQHLHHGQGTCGGLALAVNAASSCQQFPARTPLCLALVASIPWACVCHWTASWRSEQHPDAVLAYLALMYRFQSGPLGEP